LSINIASQLHYFEEEQDPTRSFVKYLDLLNNPSWWLSRMLPLCTSHLGCSLLLCPRECYVMERIPLAEEGTCDNVVS